MIQKTAPIIKPSVHPSTLFKSVQQAKEQAEKCLKTLANVQSYLEATRYEEIDLTHAFELIEVPEREICGQRGLPHLHALLNGIPVLLARSYYQR